MITPNPDNIPKRSLLFEKKTTDTFNPNWNWTRFNFSQFHIAYFKFVYSRHQTVNFLQNIEFYLRRNYGAL
jgi:hypothetical protein